MISGSDIMKRLFVILLSLAVTLSSCGYTKAMADGEEPSCSHKWREASCTVAKMCMLCVKAEGKALGHTTNCGICERCGMMISETFGTGDTAYTDGEWEFTVDAVLIHYACNCFSDKNDLPQCVIITYSYSGYERAEPGFIISPKSFDVYDAAGRAAVLYPCTHAKRPNALKDRTSFEGEQAAYALYNISDKIKFILKLSEDGQKAVFEFKVK